MEEGIFGSEVDSILFKVGLNPTEEEKRKLFWKLLNLNGRMNPGVFNFIYKNLINKITKKGEYEIINEKENNSIIINDYDGLSQLIISYSDNEPNIVFFMNEEYIVDQELFDEELNDYLSSMLTNSSSNYIYYNYMEPNTLEAELYYSSNCIMSFSDKGVLQKIESEYEDNNKDNYLARAYDIILEYYESKLEILEDTLDPDEDAASYMYDDIEMYDTYFSMDNDALIEEYNKALTQYNALKQRLNRLEHKISKSADIRTYNTTIYDSPSKESYTLKIRTRIKEDK